VRLSHPLFSGPQPSGSGFLGLCAEKVFDFWGHFSHSVPMETDAIGFRLPGQPKAFANSRLPVRRDRSLNPLLAEEKE
jgi:hypothetical protein